MSYIRIQPKGLGINHKSWHWTFDTWTEAARRDLFNGGWDDEEIEAMTDEEVAEAWEENDDCHAFAHAGLSAFDVGMKYDGENAAVALMRYIEDTRHYDRDIQAYEVIEFDGDEVEEGWDGETIVDPWEIERRFTIEEFKLEYAEWLM